MATMNKSFAEKLNIAAQVLPMQMITRYKARNTHTFAMQIYWNGTWITVGELDVDQWLSENQQLLIEDQTEQPPATNNVITFPKK